MAIINERNKEYNYYTSTLNTVNSNPSQNSNTKKISNIKISNNSNNKSNKNIKNKTEIKLAMVNAANITFTDIDNEYVRYLRR